VGHDLGVPSESPSPLRVAIDATPLLGVRTGVGHVTAGFVETLAARDDIELVAYGVTRVSRGRLARAVPAGVRACTTRLPARALFALWERGPRPRIERWTGAVNVVHATNFVGPPARARVLVTIHDLTFLRFPEMCTASTLRYGTLVQRALERGAVVHVVSDFVADEVRDAFGLPTDRVRRVYAGLAATAGGDAGAGRRLAGADRYVLTLGTLEPRKNLPALVRAFDAVASTDGDLVLALAGPDGWGSDGVHAAVAAARHGDRVHRLGYVPDEARRDLLAGATVVAYPSIYEGFGHTPLEAMVAGIPVVAAAAGALPEVLGDAALLVDPSDEDALAAALARALGDEALRRDLVTRGRERATRYPWSRAGDEMAALYRGLAPGS